MNKWYTPTKENALQGLVIDEVTGENIAVTYDPKNAQKIAALPELIEALKSIAENGGSTWDYATIGNVARRAVILVEGDN